MEPSSSCEKWYGGWLYGNDDERDRLIELGVKGVMSWSPSSGEGIGKALGKRGTFAFCLCNEATLDALEKEYGELWKTKYPHYDEGDKPYPRNQFSVMTLDQVREEWGEKYVPT